MSLAGYDVQVTSFMFADQTADRLFGVLKAPAVGATIKAAYLLPTASFNADANNHYTVTIMDGGADGTGTVSMGSFGGASVDTTANTAEAFTMTSYSVDGGDWINVNYDETGTVAPGNITVCIHWTAGGS